MDFFWNSSRIAFRLKSLLPVNDNPIVFEPIFMSHSENETVEKHSSV